MDKYLTPGISPGSTFGAGTFTPHSTGSRWAVSNSEKDAFQQQQQQQHLQNSSIQSKTASQSVLFGRSNSYQLDQPTTMMHSSSDIADSFRHNAERVEFAPITALVSYLICFYVVSYHIV